MPGKTPEPALVAAPELLWRVERVPDPLRFSQMAAVDANLETGNRFDVAGAGVLYVATEPAGAFAETLAGFRPASSLLMKMAEHDTENDRSAPGVVTQSWRIGRRLRSLRLRDPLPFIDVDDPATHTYLTREVAAQLSNMGVSNLDVATVRGPSRVLTRAIASWAYSQADEHDRPLYAGIRYGSRLGGYECWAIFEGAEVEVVDELLIDHSSPGLAEIESDFALTIQ